MGNLKEIVGLKNDNDYKQLIANGSLTYGDETITFDEDSIYVTPDDFSEALEELQADVSDLQDQIDDIDLSAYVDRLSTQEISGVKTFVEQIGIKNTDGTTDYIKHINNNLLISTSTGTNLLNIDEGLSKIYAFNKELAFKTDVTGAHGTKVYVSDNTEPEDSLNFDSDPQTQLTNLQDASAVSLKYKHLGPCVLDAPNGVLSYADGVCTAHKGLKVLLPNGRDENGEALNEVFELPEDFTFTPATDSLTRQIILTNTYVGAGVYVYGPCATPPPIAPGTYERYYNSTDNKCYYHNDTMTVWAETSGFVVLGEGQFCGSSYLLNDVPQPVGVITRTEATKHVKVNKFVNPNLLYNSDFRLVSNGVKSTATDGVELADGWYTRTRQIQLNFNQKHYNPGGIRIMSGGSGAFGGFTQIIRNYEFLYGKTVTLAIKIKSVTKGASDTVGVGIGAHRFITSFGTEYGIKTYTTVKDGDVLTGTFTIPSASSSADATVPLKFWILAYNNSGDGTMAIDIEWAKLEIGKNFTGYEYESSNEISRTYMPSAKFSRAVTTIPADGTWTGTGPITHKHTISLYRDEFITGVTYGQKSNGSYNNGEIWRIAGCSQAITAIYQSTYEVTITTTLYRTANDGTNAGSLVYYIARLI